MTAAAWMALGDSRRRALLDLLRQRESSVGDLVARIGLSQPATSKHLRVLRDAGLVQVRSQAQRRLYRVDASAIADIDAWLAPYRQLWNGRLDALGQHLDRGDEGA